METKIVIFGNEILLKKSSILNAIAKETGRDESSFMMNGKFYFVKDFQAHSEKELMLEVIKKLEEVTEYKLSGEKEEDIDWIFEKNQNVEIGDIIEFFLREELNIFQIEKNPLFQREKSKKEGVL
ncbi:MAG: hypothetical protein ACK5N8_01030 [Alphaproteobacteria bacterium]